MDFSIILTVILVTLIHLVPSSEPLTWPAGTYGLPKPKRGCPSGWRSGWRYHDTEDVNSRNRWSNPFDLSGYKYSDNMRHEFCIKTQTRSGEGSWPKGSYCIYKKGLCPSGFQSGYIFWDDEDFNNKNKIYGTLPDGIFGRNTQIYFCCRHDGLSTTPISLPNEDDFVLFSLYDRCQSVYGTMRWREWFIWDTEDVNNHDSDSGLHPYQGVEPDGRNIKLNFCYYRRYVAWPDGTYGLPKPLSGCDPNWATGSRYQHTEYSNRWSDSNHLSGSLARGYLQHGFCIKTIDNHHPGRSHGDWPAGNYCIYRKGGTCPKGFSQNQDTYIYWDDHDGNNANSYDGTLPDGMYNMNTRIQFCCRNDGYWFRRISLPTHNNFYLFSPTSTCQLVSGMNMKKEWLYWDNENSGNADRQSLIHPYEGKKSGGISLTFCYYERSVY